MTSQNSAAPARPGRSIGFHMAVYMLGALGSRLIGFLMLPIYTRKLTPEDYGTYELLSITTSILGIVLAQSVRGAILRFYHQYDTRAESRRVISTATLLINGWMAVVLLGLQLAAPGFSALILGTPDGPYFFRLIFVAFCFDTAGYVPQAFFRAEERSGFVVVSSLGRLLLGIGLNILFVVVYDMGVEGVLLSGILVAVVSHAATTWICLRTVGLGFDRAIIGPMLRFGLPLIPASLAFLVINFGDRYFLKRYIGLAETGIYALAYRFGMLITALIGEPFGQIWGTRSLRLMKAGDRQGVVTVFDSYVLLLFGAWVGLSLMIGDVMAVVVGKEFRSAESLVPLLAFAYVLRSLADFFMISLTFRYQTKRIAVIRVLSAVVCLGLYVALIPRLGAFGAALATIGTFALLTGLLYRAGQRALPHPHNLLRLGWLFSLAVVVIAFARGLPLDPGLARFAIMGCLSIAYLFVADPARTAQLADQVRAAVGRRLGRAT